MTEIERLRKENQEMRALATREGFVNEMDKKGWLKKGIHTRKERFNHLYDRCVKYFGKCVFPSYQSLYSYEKRK